MSKDDYFSKLKKNLRNDGKGTREVTNYMPKQWFYGNFSNWQIFDNPPGWANKNSNIEFFNVTIKRDYSLRRRQQKFDKEIKIYV